MRLLDAIACCVHLRLAMWHDRKADTLLDRIEDRRRIAAGPLTVSQHSDTPRLLAAEKMLLASIVGLGIFGVWLLIVARAGL